MTVSTSLPVLESLTLLADRQKISLRGPRWGGGEGVHAKLGVQHRILSWTRIEDQSEVDWTTPHAKSQMAPEDGRGPGSRSRSVDLTVEEGRRMCTAVGTCRPRWKRSEAGRSLARAAHGAGCSGCWAHRPIRVKGDRQALPAVYSYEAHCPS